MRGFRTWGLALLLAAQAPSLWAATTGLKYISTSGDYIGQGLSQSLTAPAAAVTASGGERDAHLSVTDPNNWWYLDFAAPVGGKLAPGSYANAARYPFNSPLGSGLSMSGNGRGCNALLGWFKVLEYQRDSDGKVSKLAIDFLQKCEVSGPPLYGAVRYNSKFALAVPDVAAIAGADFGLIAGEAGTLDGSQSFGRKKGRLTYQWTQLDGPAVTLSSTTVSQPSFTAPTVPLSGASLRFQLTVTDKVGVVATDDVVVMVQSPDAPRTEISFHGDKGDYITGGRSYKFSPNNASIGFSRNFSGGVSASVSGDSWWYFDTATPTGTSYKRGAYKNAQRFPFQDATSPGLSLYGDGRGCNTLSGKFTVNQLKFDSSGNPTKLDITFEQHCEGGQPAAYGQVLLNAVPAATLAQQLRAARQRYASQAE